MLAPESASSLRGHEARGFTLTELMVMVAIIVVVLAVTVPSFTTISRDLELSKARSERLRRPHRRPQPRDPRATAWSPCTSSATPARLQRPARQQHPTIAAYNQSTRAELLPLGRGLRLRTGLLAYGLPHVPTNKMTMRLEVPNPDSLHNTGDQP